MLSELKEKGLGYMKKYPSVSTTSHNIVYGV